MLMVMPTQTQLRAFGLYSSGLGMDTTTTIALDTHRSMSQNGVTSTIIGTVKQSFGSSLTKVY